MPRPRLLPRLAVSVVAGLALWLAFPGHDLWLLAPVGVALLAWASLPLTFWRAFLCGLVAGLAFFLPTLSWSGTYVGWLPWVALATLEAFYVALMAALTAYVFGRFPGALGYAAVPLGWVVQELARGTTPFGGFPWAKLAFSQTDSPLARLAFLGGAPAVTLTVAAVGVLLLYAVRAARARRPRAVMAGGAAAGAVLLAGLAVPIATDGRQVTVGFVQGNVPAPGLDFNAERRKVLDNHVAGTERLARLEHPELSLVVWPENSSDIDPLRNADAAEQVDRALRAVGVPVLVGAVLREPVGHHTNASLLYRPGAVRPERYVKIHIVPFAEYIPYRSFFRVFSDKADLAGNFVGGRALGRFRLDAHGGAYWVVPTICFEVAYDDLMRDAVTQPATEPSLLVVQTNNATFGFTDESVQQLAISRIRAIEHGRSVLHVSTVGVSGLVAPDGSLSARTGLFTAEEKVVHPVVRSGQTPADRLGMVPETTAVVLFVVLCGYAAYRARGDRVDAPARGTPRTKDEVVDAP